MSHILLALTFDGGPDGVPAGASPRKRYNTTERVLGLLASPGELDPRLRGSPPIRAAFFVQTHVPRRMADAAGQLGTAAALTHGQTLVRRMMADGHLVGVLNGSAANLEPHPDQAAGDAPALRANLERAVAALRPLLPAAAEGKQREIRFVRAPFGMHDARCDAEYLRLFPDPLDASASLHRLWHTQAAPLPPGDLTLGVSLNTKRATITRVVRAAARRLQRQINAAGKDKPAPAPVPVVIQLHDTSVVTAAHVGALVAAALDGGTLDAKRRVPVRLCSTLAELESALRQAPSPSTHTRLDRLRARQPYSPEPHMTRGYGIEEETLLAWALIEKEGWVPHLYLDSRKIPTAGVGTRVFREAAGGGQGVAGLPLRAEDGTAATDDVKKKAFDALVAATPKVATGPHLSRLRKALAATRLHLPDAEVVRLLERTREEHLKHLSALLRELRVDEAGLPLPVWLALADMIFNVGPAGLGQYKLMFTSIRGARWREAADRCRRTVLGDEPGNLVERNAATRELFLAASILG